MVATKNVYQSKWGFHPCDKETFKMLKFLHKHWYITLRQAAALDRWERKDPQNRVIREWFRDAEGRRVGSRIVGPRPEPQVCPHFNIKWGKLDPTVVKDYQNARMPRLTEEAVQPLTLSDAQIADLYHKVRGWFGY